MTQKQNAHVVVPTHQQCIQETRTMNSRRRTWKVAALGALVVAIAIGGASVIAGNDDPDEPDTPMPVEPDGGIGDTPVGDEFPTDLAREHARRVLGALEDDLPADVRIGRRGDELFALTEDYRLGRLTVELDELRGQFVVTAVTVELPDGPETLDADLPIDELPEEDLIVDDGTFDSLDDMADASDLVVVGEVSDTISIGRLAAATNPTADEFLAITVQPSETMRGSYPGDVIIAWAGYSTDEDGARVAVRTVNGVRPPAVGDRVVLFLRPVDPGFADFAGGAPTHELIKLDGIGFVIDDVVTEVEAGSLAAELLRGMTVTALREAISSN
jgi:hypothetical protein